MIDGQKVLGLVPARGGSKGIPDKNIVPLGGRPLIAWTIEAANRSVRIDHLVLSSDDERIIEAAGAHGCPAPFKRDAALATDTSSTMDVVLDALDRVPGYDYVVLLQPTSPLRTAADIDGCIDAMHRAGAPAAVSVRTAHDHPFLTFRSDGGGRLSHFAPPPPAASLRRQDLPAAWCLNGAVYVARTDWLRRHRSFLSPDTVGFPMPVERSVDIDTPDDLAQVRSIVEPSA